jgi:hypothetical protein
MTTIPNCKTRQIRRMEEPLFHMSYAHAQDLLNLLI